MKIGVLGFQGDVEEHISTLNSLSRQGKKVHGMRNIVESIPMKRMATPDEIGKLVAFLCSPDSAYITGTNIQIDGGIINYPF